MKKNLISILVAAACLSSCATPMVILHVNDTHSHLEPLRSGERIGMGGVIERAALVDSIRKAEGEERVLLLHAGDFNQGSSYYSELGGMLEVELVNALGYDAIALGNHEFDNGLEDLAKRVALIECPVICANVDFAGTPLEGLVKPYCVIERKGRRIGILGLTSDLSINVSRKVSSKLTQLDDIETIDRYVSQLKKEEKCDFVILLSHLGYKEDMNAVEKTRGIDLVIGGHTHSFVDDFVYVKSRSGKKVPVITDGCWGLYLGRIDTKI